MADVSKILTAGNDATSASLNGQTVQTLAGVPVGVTAGGELVLKVGIAGTPNGSAPQYTSTVDNVTADGSIPGGVLSWSITALSGTVTVNGESLPVGASLRGGGYNNAISTDAINYTVASGSALVAYDTPA